MGRSHGRLGLTFHMLRRILTSSLLLLPMMSFPAAPQAKKTVCELFEDLKSYDGRKFSVKGELFADGKVAVLAASECEADFDAAMFRWPTAVHLRADPKLPPAQQRELESVVARMNAARTKGNVVTVPAVFTGRLSVLTERRSTSRLEPKFHC
jgi:hypothetical protein